MPWLRPPPTSCRVGAVDGWSSVLGFVVHGLAAAATGAGNNELTTSRFFMRIGSDFHLTYCTNIHPGEDWAQVQSSLAAYGPRLKQQISPDAPFGIGLRLSHIASVELLEENHLQAFREQLARDGLYVFTMNGFPYGSFHRTQVKDLVHAPDWQTQERGDYTIRLARILATLLPDDVTEGSISTSPLSYKPWLWAQDGGDGPRGRCLSP